jgi:asparagine synthase (glutamine-hydrolysing)
MCGIAGLIDFKNQSTEATLMQMTRTMQHRGPDGEGFYFTQTPTCQVGFGHKRLSIIDLSSGGTQPMHYKHFTILLNGEIYNYQQIKDELVALGHSFVSSSDTEVAIHAYEQWQHKCVDKFIGMFAILILNTKEQTIFGVRDRAGVKPFYYYWHNDLFLFSSELKAFHEHPNFNKQVNPAAVASFLQYGYVSAPHCIFNNSYKLQPGHYFYLSLTSKTFTITKYWDVYDAYNKPKIDLPYDAAIKETEKILSQACRYRMVADVPVGVFLSGGYDSTSVATLLQTTQTDKLKTFTIGVGDAQLNEAPFAAAIAKHLGTEHTELYCTEQDALNLIDTLPYYYDEPFGDSSAIPTMLVSAMARKQVTVSLSADAGDEVFAGYNRYDYAKKYLHKIKTIPGFARKIMASSMDLIPVEKNPLLNKDPLMAYRYRKIKELIKNPNADALMTTLSAEFYNDEVSKLIATPYTTLATSHKGQVINKLVNDDISAMMAIDYITYLPDDIMQKVDRATMSISLEGREPYLDHTVIEWAATLPTNYKYHKGVKKRILKDIVHQYIPKTMMERPKMGFAIPIAKWLQHELKPVVDDYINNESIKKYGLLQAKEVLKIKDAFYAGKSQYTIKLWYILMFQMWCNRWL